MSTQVVEVADWLHPWWDWWAGITGALWWPAWSAVFSAAALGATIYLATSNWRRERRKDASFIEGVAITCDIVILGARQALSLNGELRGDWSQRLQHVGAKFKKTKLIDQVHAIDLSKFPTSYSLRTFMELRAIVAIIAEATADEIDVTEAYFRTTIEDGERYVRALLKEARSIGGRTVSVETSLHLSSDGAVTPAQDTKMCASAAD